MFIERVMFCLEFGSEQAQVTCYLRMLKKDISQFVSTQRYDTLLEMQEAARRREIEIELQTREQRRTLAWLQLVLKQFKDTDSRFGGQRGCTCGKCGKVHQGACRSGSVCHK